MTYSKKIKNYLLDIYRSKNLLFELTKRDFQQRYKGSALGVIWALLSPLLMLAVYTFIFVAVFKLKWGAIETSNDKMVYTMMIFAGLIPFQIFSESVNRSVSLLNQSANYIKKVVIPVEILPTSIVFSTVINSLFSISLLILGKILFLDTPNWTLVFVPLLMIPITFFSLGIALLVSALGAYLKDLVYVVGLVINVLFYMSPIFYSTGSLPENFKVFVLVNPIASIIDQFREVFVLGQMFSLHEYLISSIVALFFFLFGLVIFRYLRRGFADVI